jgi:hypothetical protein
MKIVDFRDFIGGVALVALGTFVAVYAGSHYAVGQASRMGPGYFPVMLGWVLAGLGAIVVLLSFRHTVQVLQPPPFRLRALTAVLGGIAIFSLLVDRLGLVPATMSLVFVAALAEPGYRWRRTILLAVALAAIAWIIFTVGLQMQLPAFAFQE